MSPSEQLTASLRRLQGLATALDSYQTNFVTQYDITRITTDTARLLCVLAITDPEKVEEPEDLIELRERLNIVRSDIAALLIGVQNLHDKVEDIHVTLNMAETHIDNQDDIL